MEDGDYTAEDLLIVKTRDITEVLPLYTQSLSIKHTHKHSLSLRDTESMVPL